MKQAIMTRWVKALRSGKYKQTREQLRELFSQVGEDELRKVLAGNAARLYDFDLDALAPLAAEHGPTVDEIATPLTELPEHPNSALLKAVKGTLM